MMRFLKLYLANVKTSLFLLLIAPNIGNGQDNRVLVENALNSTTNDPTVLIKWYTKDLLYDEGINLYRKQKGTLIWIKINQSPIIKKENLPIGL